MQNKYRSLRNTEKFVANRDFDRAIREYKRLLQIEGEDPAILNTLGDLLLRDNRTQEAIENFRRVTEIYEESGFIAKAVAVCNKIAKLNPTEKQNLVRLADLNKRRGHRFESIRYLDQLVKLHQDKGEILEAIPYQMEMLEIDPVNPDYNFRAGQLLSEAGNKDEALQYFLTAGRAFLEKGKASEAAECGKESAQIDSESLEAHLLLSEAESILEQEKAEQKAAELEQAAELEETAEPEAELEETEDETIALVASAEELTTEEIIEEKSSGEESITEETLQVKPVEEEPVEQSTLEEETFEAHPPEQLEEESQEEEIPQFDLSEISTDEISDLEDRILASAEESVEEIPTFDLETEFEETLNLDSDLEKAQSLEVSEQESETSLDVSLEQIEDLFEESQPPEESAELQVQEESEAQAEAQVQEESEAQAEAQVQDEFEAQAEAQVQEIDIQIEEIEESVSEPPEVTLQLDSELGAEASPIEPEPSLEIEELAEETVEAETIEEAPPLETSLEEFTPELQEEVSAKDFEERLDEVDFYLKLDLKEDARRVINHLLEEFPANEELTSRLEQLEEPEPVASDPPETESDFEIEAALDDLFDVPEDTKPAASVEDPNAQLDLGVAYREMGMFEDAVAKFEDAFTSFDSQSKKEEAVRCAALLAATHLQLGQYRDTIQWADQGLGYDEINSFERKALEFDRAQAFELLGEFDESLRSYRSVFEVDPNFRDVQARISRIELLTD
jgi:tetratricopeptide (TPR) repeat protein